MSRLYSASETNGIYFFAWAANTNNATYFDELFLWRNRPNYLEDIAALRQLLQDEYGSSDSDGQMFEVVPVPDDCSHADPAPVGETVIITGDDAQGKAMTEALVAVGGRKIR